jgi:hypothetical protein
LFAATDAPTFSVSSPDDPLFKWRDVAQGGKATLGAPFPGGTATIGPSPGLTLRTTSSIGLTRRMDLGAPVPPFGELTVTSLTPGAPGVATFEVTSMTSAGETIVTDVSVFDWSVIG